MFHYFIAGLTHLMTVQNMILMNIGMFIGIIFGVIPGLSANVGIGLLLPFTFAFEPVNAMMVLLGIYCGGTYGGSISAILIGTPGTGAAAATVLDGYPLAQKGHANKALMMSLYASTVGGLFSAFALLFASPAIAKFTLNFGPPEFFALAFFGLAVIASISGDNLCKGLIAGCLGILVSMIGQDQMSGVIRFTFGSLRLMTGLGLMPVLMGVFAVAVVMIQVYAMLNGENGERILAYDKKEKLSLAEFIKCAPTMLRSLIIGSLVGIMPGVGTGVASFISYNEAKRHSRHPEEFGKGAIEGIAGPEAANNAVTGTSLIPLLTLGVPGSAVAATLLGALMMHGLIPGPNLFRSQGPIVYAIMIGFVLMNLFMLAQGKLMARFFAKVTAVPQTLLVPVLMVTCFSGAFSINNSVYDIYCLLIFGMLSYIFRKIGVPIVPILLGYILGPLAEFNFRRALAMSDGSYSIFVTRPISLIFILLTVVFVATLKKANQTGVAKS
jgi:putative tricarboxylic transport membrane protein